MPPLTPNFPAWIDGDLLSASRLNDLMDWIDTAAGLDEQRMVPFDSGANVLDCDVYGRPFYGYNSGSQVEYWLANNGDQLTIKLSGTDPAYLYWRWDGVTLNNADAVVPANATTTYNIANFNNGAGLANLYPFQPVRFMLRSTYHPNNSIFVDYIYQTDSNAPTTLGTLPAFTNGATSSAADLNAIQDATEQALACLNQPIPCQYSNDDRVGTRQYYVGWVQHQHSMFYVDVTLDIQPTDNFYVRYNGGDVTGATGRYDGVLSGPVPGGLTLGNWYKIELVVNRDTTGEMEQHVKLWSYGEIPKTVLNTMDPMVRWDHGDTASGNVGGPPRLSQMANTLGALSARLRWVNVPCRTAGSIILDVGNMNCTGAQIIDGMSGYRVHRWLAYNTFRKADGDWDTATLQWFTSGRNIQTASLPLMEEPGFYDLESTPIKPGMWFRVIGAGFAIQTPIPGANYA